MYSVPHGTDYIIWLKQKEDTVSPKSIGIELDGVMVKMVEDGKDALGWA